MALMDGLELVLACPRGVGVHMWAVSGDGEGWPPSRTRPVCSAGAVAGVDEGVTRGVTARSSDAGLCHGRHGMAVGWGLAVGWAHYTRSPKP